MRLSIDIPDDTHRDLKAKAAGDGITISVVIRIAIDRYLEGNFTLGHPQGTTKDEWDDSLAAVRAVRPISKADQAKGKSRK